MPLLEVDRRYARYDYAPVVDGVSCSVDAGEIVSIFGRNGAGKTTTLRTIMGWLRPSQGRIVFGGEAIEGMSPDRVFRKGIAFIPEDRRIFATLSVEENLILGLCSIYFRACASDVASSARRFPAASSRCWRSAAPWLDRQSSCWWMNRPKAWPRWSSMKFSTRLAECAARASRCCSWSRTCAARLLSAVPVT